MFRALFPNININFSLSEHGQISTLSRQSGATMVEFSLVVLLFIGLLGGAFEWGLFFFGQHCALNGTRELIANGALTPGLLVDGPRDGAGKHNNSWNETVIQENIIPASFDPFRLGSLRCTPTLERLTIPPGLPGPDNGVLIQARVDCGYTFSFLRLLGTRQATFSRTSTRIYEMGPVP